MREKGRLKFELLAEKAITYNEGNSRLEGVTIFVYDVAMKKTDEIKLENQDQSDLNVNQRPPIKFKVTSKFGGYNPATGKATLYDNVKVIRYIDLLPEGSKQPVRVPEAELKCSKAEWNSGTQTLTSDGRVTVIRDKDHLEGVNLTYYLIDKEDRSTARIILEKDVKMSIYSADKSVSNGSVNEKPVIIKVKCKGKAIYKLNPDTVFFSKDVDVTRGSDKMLSENLMVKLHSKSMQHQSQVNQLFAKGNVKITGGFDDKSAEGYKAFGEEAVYDDTSGLIVLTGSAHKMPEVKYGEDLISDETINIDKKTGKLVALGKNRKFGIARLKAQLKGPSLQSRVKKTESAEETLVTYKKRLEYDRAKGIAEFVGGVILKRNDFTLESDSLIVQAPEGLDLSGNKGKNSLGVRKVTARGNIKITTIDGRQALSQVAVFDTLGQTMTLSGPPDPIVIEPGKSRVRSAKITSIRITDPANNNREYNIVRAEGPGEAVFFENKKGSKEIKEDLEKATRVRYAEKMVYDEANRKAVFTEDVILTRSELVLHAGQLDIMMAEKAKPVKSSKIEKSMGLSIERLVARNKVRMHAEGKHSSSDRMIYNIREKSVTLLGDGITRARVWEKRGSSLSAERIVDYQARHRIECDGPGELTLAEMDDTGIISRSARINFKGRLIYSTVPGKPSRAQFYRGVQLRWQDMSIFGDALLTELSKSDDVGNKIRKNRALDETGDPGLLKTSINSALMTGNVKVKSIGRIASGDKAVMLRDNASVTLSSADSAELRDMQGVLLKAPRFVLYHRDNVVKADGPGTLYISASAADRAGKRRRGRSASVEDTQNLTPGMHPLDYIMKYRGEMVYNFIKRRIIFNRNVELIQQTLYGRCDQLEALLAVDQTRRKNTPENQGLTLITAECKGNVFFRRFEPPRRNETLQAVLEQGSSTNRPGTTVLVKCERSLYDVARNKITFTDLTNGVKILEQVVSRRRRASRTLYHNMDKAILDRRTGDVTFPIGKRRPKVEHKAVEGPLRFDD
jgi:lipopolysaccharide export system protein LptA